MKVIELCEVGAGELRILPVAAMAYSAKYLGMAIRYRRLSTFLYVMKGMYSYVWEGGGFEAGAGEMVYIPKGAGYEYRVSGGERYVCQAEFDTFIGDEEVVFGSVPMKFPPLPDTVAAMEGMVGSQDGYRMLSGLYAVFGAFAGSRRAECGSRGFSKISPAVGYLRSHYAEEVTSEELAAMCYLSVSQMRRIFAAEFGMSPTEYRAAERVKAASRLLAGSYESISTVAAAVGYGSQFAFSKAFRKVLGVSPREYAERCRAACMSNAGSGTD